MPVNSFENKKIAFFEPYSNFSSNPSLVSLIDELTKQKAHIDIYMRHNKKSAPHSENLSIFGFPQKFKFWAGDLKSTLRNWKWFYNTYDYKSNQYLNRQKYDLVFGIDSEGGIVANQYFQNKNVPFVYLSYEIFFKDELNNPGHLIEKEEEIAATQNSALIVIQDKWRARLLANENNLPEEKFTYLPVSPRSSGQTTHSSYLRKKFNIPEEKIIVLHSGSFEDWTCADELIESVSSWPENIVLVIHTRYSPDNNHKYVSKIKTGNYPNIILSTEPLEIKEYEIMVASADIGLLLYKPMPPSRFHQKNIVTMGLSSGKFSSYMKSGVPSISVNQKTYEKLLNQYQFGINIHDFNLLSDTINKIYSNHLHYSNESKRIFQEMLDFDVYWPEIEKKLLMILS